MIIHARLFAIYLLVFFGQNPAMAQDCRMNTKLHYINGITYGDGQAYEEMLQLLPIIKQISNGSECYKDISLKFQTSKQFLDKVKEVAGMNDDEFQSVVQGWHTSQFDFGRIVLSVLLEDDLHSYANDGTLRRIVDDVRNDIGKGLDVVILAHSLGNIYAKLVADQLNREEQRHLRVVSVGLPIARWTRVDDTEVEYTILEGDFLEELESAPPANVANSSRCASSWKCHNFANSYLKGDVSGRSIVDDLSQSLAALPLAEPPTMSYHCTLQNLVRRIEVIVEDPSVKVPCDVVYHKDIERPGHREVLWHADREKSYCEDRAKEFAQKLKGLGWECK